MLERAGLVRTERSGRYTFHGLDTTPPGQISERWPHGTDAPVKRSRTASRRHIRGR